MNRIFKYGIILFIVVAGCKREDASVFSEPANVRVQNVLDSLQSVLSGNASVNGWKVTLYPEAGGIYTFWMKFNDSNRVTMVSDFSDSTATVPKESSYRLKALQQPTLIFDTYNYIHLLSDPNGAVNGGTTGTGLESDFEFSITSDTLVKNLEANAHAINEMNLTGRFNSIPAKFVKATASEAQAYESGGLDSMLRKINNFFTVVPYHYMLIGSDSVFVADNPGNRSITFTWANGAQTAASNYGISLTGVVLQDTLNIDGITVSSFNWDDADKVFYAAAGNGSKIDINAMPLSYYLGYGKKYTTLASDSSNGQTSQSFITAFNNANTQLKAYSNNGGRYIDSVTVSFSASDTLLVFIRYLNPSNPTSSYPANFKFHITYEDQGEISLGDVFVPASGGVTADGNARTIGASVKPLTDFFAKKTFVLNWPSENPTGKVLGGLYLKSDNSAYMLGVLK